MVILETWDSVFSLNPMLLRHRKNKLLSLWSSALELMLSVAYSLTGPSHNSLSAGADGLSRICLLTFECPDT